MKLLTQNSKMKKSSKNGTTLVNWTIPAFKSVTGLFTCPNAKNCAAGCYARSGTYRFSNVRGAHEAKLKLTQSDTFIDLMITEIDTWLNKKSVETLEIRIHDAGDFYSRDYLDRWAKIMYHFNDDSRVSFYAYTKQVSLFKAHVIPRNFTVIYSYGGKQDHLINVDTDRHAQVFETLEDLESAGYINGTDDDRIASSGPSNKIGLVYHGTKNYSNTKWNQVA